MAIITTNISNVSISVSGSTTQTATISWTAPTIPAGATINSCTLTGSASSFTTGNKGATLTVNGTSVSSGSSFTINLGNNNSTTSVTASFKGNHKQTNTSVTLSNLVYTVDYTASHTVTFVDWNGAVLKTETVSDGGAATAPATPTRDGYIFTGWDRTFSNVTSNLTITAQYREAQIFTVTFLDSDGTVLGTQAVVEGTSALAPDVPVKSGYQFIGWDIPIDNITSNLTVTAQYKLNLFPPFTIEGWTTDLTATITTLADYTCGFTTAETTGWIGYYAPVPESWYGNEILIRAESITENGTLCIQTADTFDEVCAITSTSLEGTARILPGKSYIVFVRTNYLASGDVLVTNAEAKVYRELAPITSFEINKTNLIISNNSPSTIKCTITPEDAMYNFSWEVDNPIVSIGAKDLLCNILPFEAGECTLTVTDLITGISHTCAITINRDFNENTNIFPAFNFLDTWFLDGNCELIDVSATDCIFETNQTWTGMSTSIPRSWYGRTVEITYETISDNAGLYIQEADTWAELGLLNATTQTVEIVFPSYGTYSDIKIILQPPSTSGTVSITGVFARFTDSIDIPELTDDTTCIVYNNRTVGYKKPEVAEEVVENAIICTTTQGFETALLNALPGDTIYLRQGVYVFDSIVQIKCQGNENAYINIKGYPGEVVVISSTPITFMTGAKYINFENFIISELHDLNWASAVKVSGGTSYINIRNVEIYNINCREIVGEDTNGCNPLVIYADTAGAITNITVDNCFIHDCDTGWSEALTLNGNASNCLIKNCTIKDITNIGIDLAGNYEWTGTVGDPNNQTHDCVVENCLIMNCQSPYATSAGLYSDGARDNIFRYNIIHNCQCGIELGSEQPGSVSENFYIHNNLIIDSGRSIGVGAYLETGAQNRNAFIYNNTFVCGDSNKENYGLYVERSSNVNFYNNIVVGTANTKLYSNSYNSTVNAGNNCWYQPNGSKPSVDSTGMFTSPMFVFDNLEINGIYKLAEGSPCINAGVNAAAEFVGSTDMNGGARIMNNTIDIGAFETFFIDKDVLKIKENGSWIKIAKVYKKVNGVWVEQDNAVWVDLFDKNTKYYKYTL